MVKAPRAEIRSVQGRVPVVTRIYDQPAAPLAMETFVNVADPEQRSDYAALAGQEHLLLLFYDEGLTHALTKRVGGMGPTVISDVVTEADRRLAVIPPHRLDFDQAKADVMERTEL